ncbi:beta-2-microglobulin-like [Hyla sarda]|uniref:beta-2-microglobulin-like n=1 Tax=Hyla sarda TaxID=327740 RepID=UPI0024C2462B|nr:beta-2-microglobulin-like [Hyla sarda]
MRSLVILGSVALVLVVAPAWAELKSPTVNVYTRRPVEFGVENELICHCSGFHPPRITMTLKQGGDAIKDFNESDLSFERDWTYHKMIYTKFVPKEGVEYSCEVTHNEGSPKTYKLGDFF